MKKNKIIVLTLVLATLLSACTNNNQVSQNEDIEKGDIKVVEPTETKENKEHEVKLKNTALNDLYSRNENKAIYEPKVFSHTDKNGIRYTRKNIPEYGMSALIPEGFESRYNKYSSNKFGEMVSVYGNTDSTRGIQITFFSKSTNIKSEKFVQTELYEDIMNRYKYDDGKEVFYPVKFLNGEITPVFGNEDVIVSKPGKDYIELITSAEGFNYSKGKKLISFREIPEALSLNAFQSGSKISFVNKINYGVLFDKATFVMISFDEKNEKIAEEINNIVSASIAYVDIDVSYDIFSNERKSIKLGKGKMVSIPDNFDVPKTNTSNTLLLQSNSEYNTLSNPVAISIYSDSLNTGNPEVVSNFTGLTKFNRILKSRFDKPIEHFGSSETNRYYRPGKTISEGYYKFIIGNNDESGIYLSQYHEKTGDIEIFFVKSDGFTDEIKLEELRQMANSVQVK